MQTIVFPAPDHGPMAQALVMIYDNGTATIAYRERPSATWGPPIQGEFR